MENKISVAEAKAVIKNHQEMKKKFWGKARSILLERHKEEFEVIYHDLIKEYEDKVHDEGKKVSEVLVSDSTASDNMQKL